jgi:plasmid maintenance system antidote protein VapI
MTPRQLNKTLAMVGLTQMGFARLIQRNERTVRDWTGGRRDVPVEIALLLNLMLDTKTDAKDLRA